MTDEELEEFEDAMDEQAEDLHGALAEDLARAPDDRRKRPVAMAASDLAFLRVTCMI
jgi:hypothetical protein